MKKWKKRRTESKITSQRWYQDHEIRTNEGRVGSGGFRHRPHLQILGFVAPILLGEEKGLCWSGKGRLGLFLSLIFFSSFFHFYLKTVIYKGNKKENLSFFIFYIFYKNMKKIPKRPLPDRHRISVNFWTVSTAPRRDQFQKICDGLDLCISLFLLVKVVIIYI